MPNGNLEQETPVVDLSPYSYWLKWLQYRSPTSIDGWGDVGTQIQRDSVLRVCMRVWLRVCVIQWMRSRSHSIFWIPLMWVIDEVYLSRWHTVDCCSHIGSKLNSQGEIFLVDIIFFHRVVQVYCWQISMEGPSTFATSMNVNCLRLYP